MKKGDLDPRMLTPELHESKRSTRNRKVEAEAALIKEVEKATTVKELKAALLHMIKGGD